MTDGSNTVFDRVVIVSGSHRTELSVEEFLSLPLPERVGCLLDRTAEFFLGAQPIDRRRALSALRELKAK